MEIVPVSLKYKSRTIKPFTRAGDYLVKDLMVRA